MISQDDLETLNAINLAHESLALKADELWSRGWSAESVFTIGCLRPDGTPHTVLGVRVDGDIWILDSLIPVVYPRPVMPYTTD